MKPEIPEKGSRLLRLGRFSEEGSVYFVTTSCYDRQRLFGDPENVRIVFDCLDWLVAHDWIDLHCAIAMPDHLHAVVQLAGRRTLSDVIGSLKRYTGRRIRERTGISHPVWQDQYYDHRVRRDESLRDIIRYCWFNPVRKGLVHDPKDYPYWRSKYGLPNRGPEFSPTGHRGLESSPTGHRGLESFPTGHRGPESSSTGHGGAESSAATETND